MNQTTHTKFCIEYLACNQDMGDLTDKECDLYRAWALRQIESRYPTHIVSVTDRTGIVSTITDDEENREDIVDFCSRLWDACPWDF